jgi:hypothetical protein
MLLEEIASQILVNSSKFPSMEVATESVRAEFRAHFPTWSYENWNRDVSDSLAKSIISNVGKNGIVSVRFIIKDLDTIMKTL